MPAKKPARKATTKSVKSLAKKTAKQSASLKKAAASLKKEDVKLKKTNASLKKTDVKLKSDLSKLKTELGKLKKNPKAKKRELNEYNLFMRKQLRAGKNFKQAAVAWNRFKKLQTKRKPSAYNSFIASQLKQGRSFAQAVAFWKSQKKGTKLKQKIKIKRVLVKAKPQVKYRTRLKRVLVRQKPKIKYVTRTKIIEKPAVIELPAEIKEIQMPSAEAKKVSKIPEHGLPIEEISYRLLTVYFQDLARHGLKRSVSLSELVDAYHFSLQKVEQKLGSQQKTLLHEEEIAFRIVKLYFFELARFGKKRTTTLEELLNAYFFVLSRLEK